MSACPPRLKAVAPKGFAAVLGADGQNCTTPRRCAAPVTPGAPPGWGFVRFVQGGGVPAGRIGPTYANLGQLRPTSTILTARPLDESDESDESGRIRTNLDEPAGNR